MLWAPSLKVCEVQPQDLWDTGQLESAILPGSTSEGLSSCSSASRKYSQGEAGAGD